MGPSGAGQLTQDWSIRSAIAGRGPGPWPRRSPFPPRPARAPIRSVYEADFPRRPPNRGKMDNRWGNDGPGTVRASAYGPRLGCARISDVARGGRGDQPGPRVRDSTAPDDQFLCEVQASGGGRGDTSSLARPAAGRPAVLVCLESEFASGSWGPRFRELQIQKHTRNIILS